VSRVDPVLTARSPRLTESDAVEAARSLFGVSASAARDLGSERDRTFSLEDAAGRPQAILKVSNRSEDPEVLDMEAEAALHVTAVDPGLRVAVPWRTGGPGDGDAAGPPTSGEDLAGLRAAWWDGDVAHWVRLYDVLPGRTLTDAAALDDAALIAWGETTARLGLALRGFVHPRARRTMLWDVQHWTVRRVGDLSKPDDRCKTPPWHFRGGLAVPVGVCIRPRA
jgi:Ser/Thr protein kinase RdoA (MazF antagonist)